MQLRDILHVKGDQVHIVSPDASLAEVVRILVERNCGSLVVCRPERPTHVLGIITERDILRAIAQPGSQLDRARVADHMTRDLVTARPEQGVEETMGQMTDRRIRHLPIVEDQRLVGIVSIGDIVKHHIAEVELEVSAMRGYFATG